MNSLPYSGHAENAGKSHKRNSGQLELDSTLINPTNKKVKIEQNQDPVMLLLKCEEEEEENGQVSSTTIDESCVPITNSTIPFRSKEHSGFSTTVPTSGNFDNTKDIDASHILLSLNNET